jgi:hypothetical protein
MKFGAFDTDILRQINEDAFEFDVTLLVSGWWISGFITPGKIFADWFDEVQGRAGRTRGGFRLPGAEVPPPTSEQLEAARRDWADRQTPRESGSDAGPPLLYLRNAKCWHPGYDKTIDHPFLCIDSAGVEAWTPGLTTFNFFRRT